MPEIKHQTLVIVIQALASEIRAMQEALAGEEAEPEDYQILEDWICAADDLERVYEVESRTVINLPPYDQLVNR